MSQQAIFFDPSRKRWSWIKRVGTLFGLASVVLVSVFLFSLFIATPLLPDLPLTREIKRSISRSLRLAPRSERKKQYILGQTLRAYRAQLEREQRALLRRKQPAIPPAQGTPIVAAFYAPWQGTGVHSLNANASKLTHLLPIWVQLAASGDRLDYRDWNLETNPTNVRVLQIARANNLSIVPVLSNAVGGQFDAARVHVFLNDRLRQERVINELRSWVTANHFQGINVDFENLDAKDYPRLIDFLQRMRKSFAPQHLSVSADLEAEKPIDIRRAAAVCDFVVVMIYDYRSVGTTEGPISPIGWYRDVVARVARIIPRDKLVIGLANYAYDWAEGDTDAEPLTYQQALLRARQFRPSEPIEKLIDFDPQYLNPTYWYDDNEGTAHEVWLLDAVTAANQWSIAQSYAPRGVAVWALGMTDPTIWNFIDRNRIAQKPVLRQLEAVVFPYHIEFVGDGEITKIAAQPQNGARTLEIDPQTQLVVDEVYSKFPTSFVIERSGYHPGLIALTIDDGPAEPYTSEMLDEMKQLNVKATFFLIGENAERYPNLVRRIWNEGHEIGNHSYTHPNLGTMSPPLARLEINATQRVFQSLINRSTLLFRPPYNADAEPSTKEEVGPIELASALNYVTVLETIDPQDWNEYQRDPNGSVHRRTAEEMLQSALAQIGNEKGSCILLHDGGGNRRETVRLLPMLVKELRAKGYKFVNVSDLIGAARDQVNPPVTANDTVMLASDRMVFEAMYLFDLFLTIAFISGITLGTLRVLFVTVLALVEKRRSRNEHFDEAFRPPVSVIIAAFNEQKVIARTIEAVLSNNYPGLELIVVDDGSADDTAGEVERRFGESVRVLRQENSGKAAALNNGISQATGEIIIALDADTIFADDTIAKLVRRFADPLVGAVAGNVKVGNRLNPLTYWQSIEYITSQNLDRRAYAVINSVPVVPGAVGAWRREAVRQAGGYTTDTMAEDMDLTWRIRRIGWRIGTDSAACGYTEAPDSFRSLFKQRFRWAFGTLQCLWKHRRALGRYGWFGRVMLPTLWLFQVAYQAISPLVDLQIIWSVFQVLEAWARTHTLREWHTLPQALSELYLVAFMYAFFFVMELIGSLIAFRLDREDPKTLVWLFWQRFLYRQLMYAVLLKSLTTAMSGMRTGWGKLERKGTVELQPSTSGGVVE